MKLSILGFLGGIADKLFPDAKDRDDAKLKLAQLHQDGAFKEMEISMQAILMEAKSNDPWTSRARPAFLYVMYIFILFAIPMGALSAWKPEVATQIAEGTRAWLAAIPDPLYALFGAGYLGYVKKRSDDKSIMLGKEPKKFLGF